jgi:hypothetical protein
MINPRSNPFEELYVSEPLTPREFVQVFSPALVNHALPLFQRGNVILRGVQGSGKTMLLKLLHPAIRIAYQEANVPFPVPADCRRFIGAGVNLRKQGFWDFGQRRFSLDPEEHSQLFPLFFGDFLNYRIVENVLRSIETYVTQADGLVALDLGLNGATAVRDAFARAVARDSCWFGYLDGIRTYKGLRERLSERIEAYLMFVQHNPKKGKGLSRTIRDSKTRVGQPVAALVSALWEAGIVPRDVHFFVSIDQYEELRRIAPEPAKPEYGYQRVVNKALGTRNQFVSYRVGVRRDSWRSDMHVHGSAASLEGEREYQELDLEDILRRKENRNTWVFPRFAEDVFRRRLEFAGYSYNRTRVRGTARNLIAHVLGARVPAEEKARLYVRKRPGTERRRLLEPLRGLPRQWRVFLDHLAERSPLGAVLAAAWLRQKDGVNARSEPPSTSPYPWDRVYWRKERVQQALMRLASVRQQRQIFAGADDVLNLSGGNVLVFVSMMRSIWAAWIRSSRAASGEQREPADIPAIPPTIQTVGIHVASDKWFAKIVERPGGDTRQRFMTFLASVFQRQLLGDLAMSYPGHNGFSLSVDDYSAASDVRAFLEDAVDYGDLVDSPHTTKEKNRRARRKWYLMPILAPYFRIPATHVKEPMYVTTGTVRAWMRAADNERLNAQGLTLRSHNSPSKKL